MIYICIVFQVILEKGTNEKGEEELLIPGALDVSSDNEWMSDYDAYGLVYGRQCCSGKSFSLRTLNSIQHTMGKMFGVKSTYFFKDGVFMRYDRFEVYIKAIDSHSKIQVIIAVLKRLCKDITMKKIKKICAEMVEAIFNRIVCFKVYEKNPKTVTSKLVVSFQGMKQGRDVAYEFEDVVKHFKEGCTFIHKISLNDESKMIYDNVASLLTSKEIQVTL